MKRNALILTGILLIACVAVTGYQFKDKNQLLELNNSKQNPTNPNINQSNMTMNQESSKKSQETPNNQNSAKYENKSNTIRKYDSQSIAGKYIEEEGAVAGKPKRVKIGGTQTDVVPVISNGKQVGEIHIDPKTGENVGGAGGAP